MDGTSTAIVFRSPERKRFYSLTYCAGRCEACEIHAMLMAKYSDD